MECIRPEQLLLPETNVSWQEFILTQVLCSSPACTGEARRNLSDAPRVTALKFIRDLTEIGIILDGLIRILPVGL
jgi:hypothetical protein